MGITAPSPAIEEIPKCVSWSVDGKNMCIPVGREGDWLTPSVEAPSSSQICDSQKLQQESYAAPSGSIWEKMTYTEKYVTSLFKNLKLHLKWLLSHPVM